MALPLIVAAAVPVLVGVVVAAVTHPMLLLNIIARRRKLDVDALLEVLELDGIEAAVSSIICENAQTRAGLVLDPADPFSDISLATALGGKIGIPLTSVKDVDILKSDVASFAQAQIAARSGLQLNNILDADTLRADVGIFASEKITAHVGVPLTNVLDVQQTKTELNDWAVSNFVDYVQTRLMQVSGGADLSGVGGGAKQGLKDGLSASEVMSTAFAGLVNVMLDKLQKDMRRARRKEQNRHAQRRFRALHGCRMRYERLIPTGG